jgi:hypothetical protein
MVMDAEFCECTKDQWIVHIKWVNCKICELYHKAVFQNNKSN